MTKQHHLSRSIHSTPTSKLSFPCLDKIQERERTLSDSSYGPEPIYSKIVEGYSTFTSNEPFYFVHGGVIPKLDIAYESWGELSPSRDNVILLCTGLSASSHAKSHERNRAPGWWEKFIGPGLPLDTNKFHIICTNVLGGCYGSTGPSSVNPESTTGERYGTHFPVLTIWDMVRAQFRLLDHLGVEKLHAVVGSSMGGMQSLAAAALFPDRVGRIATISAAARSHPLSIALRQVLMTDPNWNRGFYYQGVPPHVGMKLARQIATITYRSGPEWEQRFGRKRTNPDSVPGMCADFMIETYLDHQGEKFCLQYDPNSLLFISKAMDLFDMSQLPLPDPKEAYLQKQKQQPTACDTHRDKQAKLLDDAADNTDAYHRGGLVEGMSVIKVPTLVLGVQSDILFPIWQQKEIAECLRLSGNKSVTYHELDAMYGHDTFLIDRTNVGSPLKGHLENDPEALKN
ncbi:hypothetical protein HDV05_007383 [Chytridiales sp. JEL 0842]|nr:hypothetical protein HDV05_007383 [Chytridiales sp. JEL 0842]